MISVQEIGNQQLYDEILKQIKRGASFIRKFKMKCLTKKDALECKYLVLEALELTDLNFLRFFPNITALAIKNVTGLQNVEGIHNCSQLTDLNIFDASIYGLESLQYCKRLNHLSYFPKQDFGHCLDLSFLKNLSELDDLEIVGCNISDVSMLAHCKKLEYLNLSNNPIKSIEPLRELPLLRELELQRCNLKKLDDISAFSALEAIVLIDNLFSKDEMENIISLYSDIHICFE